MSRARILADYVATGVTAAEFDVLDGLTSTTAELNRLDGITSAAVGLTDSQTLTNKTLTSPVVNTPSLPTFVGMIASFGMASAPTGWIICDGAAVSRTVTYDALFAVIGTTWGTGNGSSTFNLPDLRGAFLRGTGSHGKSNMADGNDFAGAAVGAFEDDQLQRHAHYVNKGDTTTQVGYPPAAGSGYAGVEIDEDDFSGARFMARVFNAYDFGTPRTGDETRPFNASINYCIKY